MPGLQQVFVGLRSRLFCLAVRVAQMAFEAEGLLCAALGTSTSFFSPSKKCWMAAAALAII